VDFVEICNVYVGKMIIKAVKRIFNSDKLCRSYSDLNFGVTFFGTQCMRCRPIISPLSLNHSDRPMCNNGITQFYLPPTHEPCLPLLISHKASLPFGWYSLRLPTNGWRGSTDLDGQLHTEINVPQWELSLNTVTHPPQY